jgi:hypothetical protein
MEMLMRLLISGFEKGSNSRRANFFFRGDIVQ